jgi:uncharacterized protein YkwD
MKVNALCLISLIVGLSVGSAAKADTALPPPVTGSGTASGQGTITGTGTVINNGDGTETITGTVTIIGKVTVKISDLAGPAQEGAVKLDADEETFVSLINALRTQHGLAPLKLSDKLSQLSQWMSTDMASKNYFSHTDSSGKSPFDRMNDVGYHAEHEGENIAAGNGDAQSTYLQWLNSPPHLQNMLSPDYTEIGVGRAYNANADDKWYWTTDFGSN